MAGAVSKYNEQARGVHKEAVLSTLMQDANELKIRMMTRLKIDKLEIEAQMSKDAMMAQKLEHEQVIKESDAAISQSKEEHRRVRR